MYIFITFFGYTPRICTSMVRQELCQDNVSVRCGQLKECNCSSFLWFDRPGLEGRQPLFASKTALDNCSTPSYDFLLCTRQYCKPKDPTGPSAGMIVPEWELSKMRSTAPFGKDNVSLGKRCFQKEHTIVNVFQRKILHCLNRLYCAGSSQDTNRYWRPPSVRGIKVLYFELRT